MDVRIGIYLTGGALTGLVEGKYLHYLAVWFVHDVEGGGGERGPVSVVRLTNVRPALRRQNRLCPFFLFYEDNNSFCPFPLL